MDSHAYGDICTGFRRMHAATVRMANVAAEITQKFTAAELEAINTHPNLVELNKHLDGFYG